MKRVNYLVWKTGKVYYIERCRILLLILRYQCWLPMKRGVSYLLVCLTFLNEYRSLQVKKWDQGTSQVIWACSFLAVMTVKFVVSLFHCRMHIYILNGYEPLVF